MVLGWRALGNRFSLGHLAHGGPNGIPVGDGPFLLLMILVLNGNFCNANRNEHVFFEKNMVLLGMEKFVVAHSFCRKKPFGEVPPKNLGKIRQPPNLATS